MLYIHHYGLKEKPFQDTANPKFLWLGEKQLKILRILKCGVQKNTGITLLTGDVGTGKTILLNYLAESLRDQVLISRINNPDLDTSGFLHFLSDSINPGASFEDKVAFLSRIILASSNKKMILIIIDEAHLLTDNLLEELSLLLKIKKRDARMVNIIFAGQETSFGTLKEEILADMIPESPLKCHLEPLTKEETNHYIRHCLRIAGATRNPFSLCALGEIARFSGGIPRIINSICDKALLIGYVKNKKILNSAVVKECAEDSHFVNRVNDPKDDLIPMNSVSQSTRFGEAS
jgi:general secretion pathway protein A